MPYYVYSIRVSLESVKVRDPDDGDVYFVAKIGGTSFGRSKIFQMSAGQTADLKPLNWYWEKAILGIPGAIPIELSAWDKDTFSADDPLGVVVTTASSPWTSRELKVGSADGNLELTYDISVTVVAVTGSAVAVVSRQHDGSPFVSTLAKPNVAVATLTKILGLYKPGVDNRPVKASGTTRDADYVDGYLSDDDAGRIFTNRLTDGTWQTGWHAIEITAVVEPAGVKLPANAKMVWSFEDPDDPTNEPPNVHPDAGKILDPNDYSGAVKTAAAPGDNDPSGKKKSSPKFEEVDPKYALSGNETLIDAATRTTRVRFRVSDIAGDNYRIKAVVKADPSLSMVVPAQTGIMTVWHRVDIEYIRMQSAAELPVEKIKDHYAIACVQVDVSLKRIVTGASDLPEMGSTDAVAYAACDGYATKASGEFSMEGQKGWFFIAAANAMLPAKSTSVLYEGKAEAQGDRVRLPAAVKLGSTKPAVVRIFNPAKIVGMPTPKPNDYSLHTKFQVAARVGRDLLLITHDFHEVDNPDVSFLDADLTAYGMAPGTSIDVQVMSEGDEALITGGISPGGVDIGGKHYFGGRLLVFTRNKSDNIGTLCHELCHAFDNAHKCGNWDWTNQPNRTSCCMCYWFQFVLDDSTPRKPIAWTQNRASADLCAHHVRRMRDYHLEDNPGLGW